MIHKVEYKHDYDIDPKVFPEKKYPYGNGRKPHWQISHWNASILKSRRCGVISLQFSFKFYTILLEMTTFFHVFYMALGESFHSFEEDIPTGKEARK